MTHDGSGVFAVQLLDEGGQLVDLLANKIGRFEGSKAVGAKEGGLLGAQPGTHILNITADGNWTVSIEQPRTVERLRLPQTLSGRGQRVSSFFTLASGLAIFRMTHEGSGVFAMQLLDEKGQLVALLANKIGGFDGSKAVGVKEGALLGAQPGTHILNITADGNWTVSIEQ